MFKPTAQFRNAAQKYESCAYIYRDGIALIETKTLKAYKNTKVKATIAHLYPAEITIRQYSHKPDSPAPKIKRIVCHDPSELFSGIQSINIDFYSGSGASQDAGLNTWHIEITTPNGTRWNRNCTDLIADNLTIQPNPQSKFGNLANPGESIREWINLQDSDIDGIEEH